jgi:hypothetical protein
MKAKLVIEKRASVILFNFLKHIEKTFRGKKMLIPANVCPIVPATLIKAQIKFEFVDISKSDFCMDKETVISLIDSDSKIGGVLFVRTYGYMRDETDFFEKLRIMSPGLVLIDDRCLCIPDINGNTVYDQANLTLYSTGYAKFVELNEGGFGFVGKDFNYIKFALSYSEADHNKIVSAFQKSIDTQTPFLYNDSDWLDTSALTHRNDYFSVIEQGIIKSGKTKSRLNNIYKSNLPKEIQLGSKFHNWRFNIFVSNKSEVLSNIFKADLFASSHYTPISHLFGGIRAKNADRLHSGTINLFNDFRFTSEMALKVCEIIKKTYNV